MDPADLASFVDGWVLGRMRSEHVAGAVVAVVHGGSVLLARGYGFADVEAGRRVDAEGTLFRPGSISKTFTWTAVMQLAEAGKVDLGADVGSYLPDLPLGGDGDAPITLEQLMAHTPGFEESVMGHLFEDDPRAVPPLLDYLQAYQPARVRPPGALPAYSNYGVAVAGLVVAEVSGEPFEDYVESHLLQPLGMANSTFREPWGAQRAGAMPARLARQVSRGYRYRAGAYEAGAFEFIGHVGPAGALSTSAADMARWMLAHLNHGALGETRILSVEGARRLHRRHHTVDPEMPGMAHGFIESFPHGYRAIGHGGGTVHFLSDMQLVPALGLGVFISTNTAPGGATLIDGFVPELVARYFPPGPASLDDVVVAESGRSLSEYAGAYLPTRRPFTTVERLLLVNGARVAAMPDGTLLVAAGGQQTRLAPLGGDTFRTTDTGQRVKFTSGVDGAVNAMLLPVPVFVMEKVGPLQDPMVLFGLLLAAGLVLAAAVAGAWLRRRRPPPQTLAEAWAGRIVVATALVWLAAYAGAALGLAPIGEDFANVFYRFPTPAFRAALALGLAGAVLTVLSVLLLYPVWWGGRWPLWRRLRHTGVVAAALVTLLVLRDFNAIGFNFIGS